MTSLASYHGEEELFLKDIVVTDHGQIKDSGRLCAVCEPHPDKSISTGIMKPSHDMFSVSAPT